MYHGAGFPTKNPLLFPNADAICHASKQVFNGRRTTRRRSDLTFKLNSTANGTAPSGR
jgi:hypothetical protein